jgi:hypothetical protein
MFGPGSSTFSVPGKCATTAQARRALEDCEGEVFQALSRFFSPFHRMKDVSRGSFEERAAAYRHNRSLRGEISACMTRWLLCCAVASGLTSIFDTLSGSSATGIDVFVVLAAACATFIACGVCVLFVSAYVYLYLAHERW